MSRGVNPAIQQWMVSIPVREMTRMLEEVNIPLSDLEPYIRHTAPPGEDSPAPSEGSFMSAESTEFCDTMTDDVAANGQQAEVRSIVCIGVKALFPMGVGLSGCQLPRLPAPQSREPMRGQHLVT